MEGVLENVPAVRLESRHRLVGQTPFLAYLRSSSASLALLCSIVEEKSFLSKLAMTVLQDPGFPSPYLSLGFFCFLKWTHFEHICYRPRIYTS
jgi:hypothetical protein